MRHSDKDCMVNNSAALQTLECHFSSGRKEFTDNNLLIITFKNLEAAGLEKWFRDCGGVNRYGTHRLVCLNGWSIGGGIIRSMALLE